MENRNTPEIRFKGFEDEWEEVKLGDIANIVGGGTPNTRNSEYWDGNINWYSPVEIGESIYVSESRKKITELGYKNSSAKMLPANRTVLFTSRAGIGKAAILSEKACTNQGFQSLVLNDDIDPYFIYSMTNIIKEKAEYNAAGSTFSEISGKKLAQIKINITKENEQKRIGNLFGNLDKKLEIEKDKLFKLKEFKKSMLENMFPKEDENVPNIRFDGFKEGYYWKNRNYYNRKVCKKNQTRRFISISRF